MVETQQGPNPEQNDPELGIDPAVGTRRLEVQRACMGFISQYRAGTASKSTTISEVSRVIFRSEIEEGEQDKVMSEYIGLIEQVEQTFSNEQDRTANPVREQIGDQPAINNSTVSAGLNRGDLEQA